MKPTQVINVKLGEGTPFVYVGRGGRYPASDFANPYVIGQHGDRQTVIDRYVTWLYRQPALMQRARHELVGRVLGCWCAPEPCHGDVLARICDLTSIEFATLVELLKLSAASPWQWRTTAETYPGRGGRWTARRRTLGRLIEKHVLDGRQAYGVWVWRWGPFHDPPGTPAPARVCRYCGCHEDRACSDDGTGLPCHWTAVQDVCSSRGCVALYALKHGRAEGPRV